MDYKKLETILLYALLVIVGAVYLYTVSPTLSFWDCGEFIASAYTLAVPHPPGTPFYILLGRAWLLIVGIFASILPISKEIAWHMNLLGLGFSLAGLALLYKMLLKIFRMFNSKSSELNRIVIAFATCFAIAFFYTYWQNAIETEVYAAATFVFLLINYLALIWYESVKQGEPKHKLLLLAFYLIFLSTGIHLTPFLIFIPFYIFVFIVERKYTRDVLFILLGVFQMVFFALIFLLAGHGRQTATLIVLGLILLSAIVLALNNPAKYRNSKFFWITIFLIIAGVSTELYLPLRAAKLTELYKDPKAKQAYLAGDNIAPRINECDPGESFDSFNKVLHRDQYGPAQIIPRKTQTQTGYGLIAGYIWQLDLLRNYLFWQPVQAKSNILFRSIILALFTIFIVWGMYTLYRREKKVFYLMLMIMFMLTFAITGYLNLRFSPSDPNPKHLPHEVRERDYFFHTTDVYFGIFMGIGLLAFSEFIREEAKKKRIYNIIGLSGIVVYSMVPLFSNIHVNNRYGMFIPRDYGYNMLNSCDRGAVLFTNGDNDTFPLWFAQEVLKIRRDVIIANLSLINTNWYIKQLKDWGVPISFSDYVIDRLEPRMTSDRRIVYVKDIMIRNILATNAGIELENRDYFITQEEFAQKYLKGYKGRVPIYFASTVSRENFEGFQPHCRLEGLVYRVMPDSLDPLVHVDIPRTKELFYGVYRYTGIFPPDKQDAVKEIVMDFDRRKEEGEFYDHAIQIDENTMRLYTNYAAGLHSLGYILQQYGDIKGTLNAWRFARLFDAQPTHFFDYNLGLLYAQLGAVDSAEHYFSNIDVLDANVMIRIGSVYGAIGEYGKAAEYFRKAITMNPQIPDAYFGLYTIYLEQMDTASAIQVINDWLTINPRDTSAMNMLKQLQNQ
jgi:tetratricopeptide (TPR) repeat protein